MLVMISAVALSAAEAAAPKVVFYQTMLPEAYCGYASAAKPDPAAIAEIKARMPDFRTAWDKEGPGWLASVVRLTGHPFQFRETLAVLHACPDMESWSAPLMIAAARYTKAAGAGAESGPVRRALAAGKSFPRLPPKTLDDFVYVVWHEMMHRYVQELKMQLPGGQAPIQARYAHEDETVRGHIALYATEKVIWKELGREAQYAARVAEAKARGYKSHYRAMEIVEAEGADRILAELRSLANEAAKVRRP